MVPSINKILAMIKDKIDFPWQKDIHRNTGMDMGFVWKCSASKRKVPVERERL
jgi:hypothetical protein